MRIDHWNLGRKARRKKRKIHGASSVREVRAQKPKKNLPVGQAGFALLLVHVIRWGAYAALFAPLIVHPAFFFPFVVPKTVFFWIFTEIITAAWVLLALSNKQFRPKWNIVSIALGIFLLVTVITSFTGINVERSFWSTFERMAGTINWIHLTLFFLVLSSTFRTLKEWQRILSVSFGAAFLVALIFLSQKMDISLIPFNTKGGSTIGNSSFMAAYLLFNIFFGFWLFVKSLREYFAGRTRTVWWSVIYGLALVLLIFTVYISTAYGALLSMLGGGFIILLAWLFFAKRKKITRALAVFLLLFGIIAGSIVIWGTFTQNKAVLSKLPYFFSIKGTIGARKVVWDIALNGIKERPIVGWGPENFNVVFTKYFNPCLPLPECGSEIWFDRTHNTVLDSLINSGILGLLSYLSLFVGSLFLLWRNFLRNKDALAASESGDWLFPAVATAVLASYFAQNLLVFDMLNTYLMFGLTLAFISALASKRYTKEDISSESNASNETGFPSLRNPNTLSVVVVSVALVYYLFSFGVQSLEVANWGIQISRGGRGATETVELYQKSLSASPLGNRQIVEFFTSKITSTLVAKTDLPKEFVADTLAVMEEDLKENPYDYRHFILLGGFYNSAREYDPEYLKKAEEILKKAIEMSPANQQGYTALGQTYVFLEEPEKAIKVLKAARDLEPKYARAHQALGEAYALAGKKELAEESFAKAAELGYVSRK